MKRALCEVSGRVAQVVALGQDFPVALPLVWRDAADAVTEAYSWDGVQFIAPLAKTLTEVKVAKIAEVSSILVVKMATGRLYAGNYYQIGGKYSTNMTMFLTGLERFLRVYQAWATPQAYVTGTIAHNSGAFYKCLANHTSLDFATDLAAGKWQVWYFHPYLGGNGKWTTVANTQVTLTTAEATEMCQGALDYEMRLVTAARVHKDAILVLANTTLVNSYDITLNWPANT